MTFRKTWIVAIVLIIAGVLGYKYISKMKKAPKKKTNKTLVIAPFLEVKNGNTPLIIEGSGQVKAKDRIDIFSEVNGVLQKTGKDFRTGVSFGKGELMIKIDDSEFRAGLYAQRSDFQNLITSVLPDIKLEFPDEFQKWYDYLTAMEVDQPLKQLPEIKSKKEKFFITGRKIYSSFYSIRNLEARLDKYNIRAPFPGIVTESNVNPGTLIRVGQKIGVFSNTDVFELEISIKANDVNLISVGDKADIISPEDGTICNGKVSRINAAIDLNTQTVSVFVESRDSRLREGMFAKARISGGSMDNVYEIPRNILVENRYVYVIKPDSSLERREIDAVRFLDKSVIIKGFADGTRIVSRNIPGIFPGMKIVPQSSNK